MTVRTLNDALLLLLRGDRRAHRSYYPSIESEKKVYLKVPLKGETIELPILALNKFHDSKWKEDINNYSEIVVTLQDYGIHSSYVSLDRIMRDALIADFQNSKLQKVNVKQGEDTIIYYVARGAVFDKDYNPIMMISWELKRTQINEDNTSPFELKRIILRISPDCFVNKDDPMRRLIANKIVSLTLSNYGRSEVITHNSLISGHLEHLHPVVEIAYTPFKIIRPAIPRSTTTNEELVSVAYNHFDEIINDC